MTQSDAQPGVYLILCNTESDIELFAQNYNDPAFINLGNTASIVPKAYIKKNKLKYEDTLMSSYSETPNELLITILDILKRQATIFAGTSGLSYESVSEMIYILKNLIKGQNISINVCHKRKQKNSDLKKIEIDGSLTVKELTLFLQDQ